MKELNENKEQRIELEQNINDIKNYIKDKQDNLVELKDELDSNELSTDDIESIFDEYLEEAYEPIEYMGVTIDSSFLKEHSPTTYRVYMSDWLDSCDCIGYEDGKHYKYEILEEYVNNVEDIEGNISMLEDELEELQSELDELTELEN